MAPLNGELDNRIRTNGVALSAPNGPDNFATPEKVLNDTRFNGEPNCLAIGHTNGDMNGQTTPPLHLVENAPTRFEPIAVCGMACRLPGGIHSPQQLWEFLIAKRDARGAVPESRYNSSTHYSANGKPGTINSEYGYFLDEDVKLDSLDTSFFTISKTELERTDPQQRQLLEVARECIDDACEVNWRGSNTGVYAGNFGEDWSDMFAKDSQQYGGYRITGTHDMALSNRVSYEMDLRGPSLTIRTGCSASLVCLNEACAAISKGDCKAAIVGGTNLILAPGLTATASEQGILSPNASCKTFSADADGYARAEGIVAIYIKPLKDALLDRNPIRAIIRGVATNSDGKTPGMTNPSSDSQEALMRRTYSVAGITDLSKTAFVECHGTGTAAGDPIEAIAVARVFGESGIFIGSIKPNFGHLEGASGLASLIKCVLALENRTIPPNIKFSNPNPKIPFESAKLVVPVEPTTWPKSRFERISLNSFGFGGSNAHVILDSASSLACSQTPEDKLQDDSIENHQLLLYSANSVESLNQITETYSAYLQQNPQKLPDLAFTLANGREHLPHRTFVITSRDGVSTTSPTMKIGPTALNLVMAFTGQGAQWPQMGRDLMRWNSAFRSSIKSMDQFLRSLGDSTPAWNLEAELCKPPKSSRLYEAEIAQPTLTAIQIALVETLASFGIKPVAVVGHSGGEVAAAYAAGALTANEAIMVSLNRGSAIKSQTKKGAMAAIGMGPKDIMRYLLPNVNIACENSPSSVTISGDADQVKCVVENIRLEQRDVLTKVLNVDKAYHSPHMVEVGENYLHLLEGFVLPRRLQKPFFSSVTGKLFHTGEMLQLKYWQRNLESPVLFNTAVACLLRHPLGQNSVFVEVGPHSALGGPLRQIFAHNSSTAQYATFMQRQKNCVYSFLSAIGKLWTLNIAIEFKALSPTGRFIPGLPPYPWHHPNSYWHEPRAVREWRHRQYAYHDLLGVKLTESTEFEPVWRNILHLDNAPWLRDHVINDDIILPFTGYIGLIGEAIRQVAGAEDGFRLRRFYVRTALVLHEGEPAELVTTFRRQRLTTSLEGDWWEFTVASHNGHTWTKHCNGEVAMLAKSLGTPQEQAILPRQLPSQKWYNGIGKLGLHFGPHFQSLNNIKTTTTGTPMATANVRNNRQGDGNNYHVHPTVIDSALQLLCCAETYGLSRKYRMMLPTVVESMTIIRCSQDVNVFVSAGSTPSGGIVGNGMCVASGTVVVQMSGVCLSPLEDVKDSDPKDSHAAARHTWGPDIDFMDIRSLLKPTLDKSAFTPALNELTELCLVHSQRRLAPLQSTLPHMQLFAAWIDRQLSQLSSSSLMSLDDTSLDLRIDQVVSKLDQTPAACAALAMRRMATSMSEIILGETNAMEILREDDLLSKMYFLSEACDRSLFLKHLTHSKPNLRILEIGAGTGATSKTILAHLILPNGQPLYSRYTFTDISPAFLATAKETLQGFPNLEFAPLDIKSDPAEQDFKHQKFDLIIATNVIHATPNLRETLAKVRMLLADNGRLLLHELCSTSKWVNYVWGPFSGWWDGVADGRPDDPYVKPERWNADLISVGFKPLDAVVYDAPEPFQMNAIMVASPDVVYPAAMKLALLCRRQDRDPRLLMEALGARGFAVSRYNLGDPLPVEQDVLAVLDESGPFFEKLDENSLEHFKNVISSLGDNKIMWLTRLCHLQCGDPRYAQAIGAARTIRSEMLLNFATCETTDIEAESQLIADVYSKFQCQPNEDILGPDFEFIICDGKVHIGRFYPFSLSNELLTSDTGEEFMLKLTKSGRIGTLHWSPTSASTLRGDEVDVVTHAVGLNFVDVLTRMGVVELSKPTLGHEASGVVRAVGPNVKNLNVGDRVMLAGRSTFSTSIITSEVLCAKIPDEMTFVEAASMPVVYATAMQALMMVGRLEKGQSVLIHSGCGGVGLAAIQLAQMFDAEIYVTVSTGEKINHLVEQMKLPRNRIFNSRNSSFVDGIMRETRGRGVDLALNSLSGELLHETWRCIADFGTMVEIGKRDILGAGKLDMDVFLANRSYCCVDLDQVVAQKPWVINKLLNAIVQLYREAKIKAISPARLFGPNEIQDAFTFMQPGSHIGKVIVEFPQDFKSAITETQLAQNITQIDFDPLGSYLLVGGLGGLGRAIAVWMAESGARHLVFLSTSAGTRAVHGELVNELKSMGCSVDLVRGSVSDAKDVKKAFTEATARGPVKGVFQMSMVLRDRAFSRMTLDEWNGATLPKIQGTWNLHNELASIGANPDFFILFSSLSGIIGQPGQANYSSANTFLDAFVGYRTHLGLPVSAINLGSVHDIGFVAENEETLRKITAMGLHRISEQSLLDALVLAITVGKQDNHTQSRFVNQRSFVLGLGSTVPINADNNATIWKDLRMASYHNDVGTTTEVTASSDQLKSFILAAKSDPSIISQPDTSLFLATEIGKKLFAFLLKPEEELNTKLSLSDLGMDSLVAIEVRAWWRQTFEFDITVLEMLQMGTLDALGKHATDKLLKSL
ncbi:hypothetical protein L207DRAFT_592910 [Hyaloscypha variabilis F]|uniref:Uncharacterized protein n=1 Tax=Hyaloscypha variabilis (strain UAMH 11265 / GT02V1 / F) TaxID=1149755 RepID=A0A2J6QV72_HYAVF|nr:hypothetical protein L207DRAFT_592910 [Hyaloscypha variabilis F]